MSRDTRTVAQKNRAIRQDELREFLSKQKLIEKVIDNIEKIEDVSTKMPADEVNRLKIASEHRLKLISKYLPDCKSVEVEASVDTELKIEVIKDFS